MICVKQIRDIPEDFAKVKALYYRSFPKKERRSFPELVENRLGNTELLSFYEEENFIGMACLLNSPNISHIIYLAIEESLRGHGYGSQVLEVLHRRKTGKRVMVDIEVPDINAENAEQRTMRKKFYLKAGYQETSVNYTWRQEDYEILSFGGQITEAEYDQFWKDLRKE